jgi:uncharacterized protein YacL
MLLHILRALFVLLMGSAAISFVYKYPRADFSIWMLPVVALTIGVLLICIDILTPRRKLAVFSGTLFGLVVGLIIAFVLSFVVKLVINQPWITGDKDSLEQFIDLMLAIACCYLSISFVLQSKDDFRFIIPYVEFSKQTKGARPILVDTSVLIDGRITDIVETGILESQLVVPQFVINELQQVADSSDKLKRNRGRRGLDVLAKLRSNPRAEVSLYDPHRELEKNLGVDQHLVSLAQELNGRILTNDFNLNNVAQLRGVNVVNLNDLANALKPAVLPGEKMSVRVIKRGEDAGQGVGYLDDGTMVVVEQGAGHVNQEVEFTVTNTRQTSAGKMIFGRLGDAPPVNPSSRKPRSQPSPT